ncbi:MAG: serine/threonine protein kinase [Roseburia sp.]|jgi:serine/threonine protein kinase|nr:serine/threonine protein kinase [Roseburia sp.]
MSSTINSFDKNEIIMDRYEILAEIGSGGFATTYKAMDHSLDIPVAIKAFHKHTGASMDEAVKEAKIAAGLYELEGIASARDFFWYKETPCIIMDYVDGTSIKDYVREHGRIRGDKMLILIKPLLQSLIKIHEKGILHRDISADNILLTEDGRLKLIDFGAARLSQNAQGDEYTIIFKRGFAPIEQCSAGGKQGPWTDVYGICATMYYMITGIVPDDSVSRLIEDKLLPLERIDGVRLTPQAMSCIMKGLAVRPEKRFQSMSEFYTALYAAKPSTLANILNNTTIQGGKVENGEANFTEKLLEDMELSISHKKSRRKKQIIIGAVVAVLLILSGSIWGILQHRSTVKDQIPHAPASSITPAVNSTSAEPDADLHSSDNPADADADSTDTPANAPDDPDSSNTPANQPGNSGSGNNSGNSGKKTGSGNSSGNSGSGKNSGSSSGNSGSGKNFGSSSSKATTSKKSGSGNSSGSAKSSGGSSSKATTSKKSGSGNSSGSAKNSGGSSSKATTAPKKSNTAPKKTAKPASPKNNFDGDLDGI